MMIEGAPSRNRFAADRIASATFVCRFLFRWLNDSCCSRHDLKRLLRLPSDQTLTRKLLNRTLSELLRLLDHTLITARLAP